MEPETAAAAADVLGFEQNNTRSSRNSLKENKDTAAAPEDEESPQKFVHPGESSCDICDKVMPKKSIRKHKQRVHHLYEESSFISEESVPIRGQDLGHVTGIDQSEASITEDDDNDEKDAAPAVTVIMSDCDFIVDIRRKVTTNSTRKAAKAAAAALEFLNEDI